MPSLAPVALFVYNRPDHTRQTLEALSRNRLAAETPVFVFADGPKETATDADRARIRETRDLVCTRPWTNRVTMIEASSNRGLAASIVHGVGRVLAEFDRVIVLEDDIVTSPGFLEFMNRGLELYANEPRVMHLSGYMYPLGVQSLDTVFLRILSCWGWATWSRAWKFYQDDLAPHFEFLNTPERIHKFNIEGHADFYRQLLDNRSGRIRSWAVRWYASWLAQDGLSLFPTHSLVRNIGHDGTGVHCSQDQRFETDLCDSVPVRRIPLRENRAIRWRINEFYRSGRGDQSLASIWLTNRLVLPLRRRLASHA